MAQVSEQLGRLIWHACQGGRFVIFVDDLERCAPDRALEVCEMANQVLHHGGVVTVLVADMDTLASRAQERYANGQRDGNGAAIGRFYLEKIVQIQLTLPPPTPRDMLRLLSGDRNHGEDADGVRQG
jgi:predicted KAP-like P-loop ATPase